MTALFQPDVFQIDVFQQDVGGEDVTVTIHQSLGLAQRMELRPRRGAGSSRRPSVTVVIHQRMPLRQRMVVDNHDDDLLLMIMRSTKEKV